MNNRAKNISFYLLKLWESPTLMTWGSLAINSSKLILVLPLVLNKLSAEETSVWLIFQTIIGLQIVIDMGFNTSVGRSISMGFGGLRTLSTSFDKKVRESEGTNWQLISEVFFTSRFVYFRLALLYVFLLASAGTALIIRPISTLGSQLEIGYYAWLIVVLTNPIVLYGNIYNAYLVGLDKIALLRRWDMLIGLGNIIGSVFVLLFQPNLIFLVINNQFWQLVKCARNYFLSRQVEDKKMIQFKKLPFNRSIFKQIWSPTWRSGIGVLMSYGLTQLSGLFYAQFGKAIEISSYLLSLRIVQVLSDFSRAPFYSKISTLTILRARGEFDNQLTLAKKGMTLTYWIFVLGFISVSVSADFLLSFINSKTPFVDDFLWILMGLGVFMERFGAMHIQLYSTTNRIVWHISNSISGLIYIVVCLMTFNSMGVYTFPIALLTSNLLFYSWYCSNKSYKLFQTNFFSFERKTFIPPFISIIIFSFMLYFNSYV